MTAAVSIFGYGSLLSYQSVLTTMPSAFNFRSGILTGYSRNFNLVSINGLKLGLTKSRLDDLKKVVTTAPQYQRSWQ